MYEVICPACRRMVELPAHVVVVGARNKCPKCWTWLEAVSEHPVRLIVRDQPTDQPAAGTAS